MRSDTWYRFKLFTIVLGFAALTVMVLSNEEWRNRILVLLFLLFFANPGALALFIVALAAGALIIARRQELDWLTAGFLAGAITCVVVLMLWCTIVYIWWY